MMAEVPVEGVAGVVVTGVIGVAVTAGGGADSLNTTGAAVTVTGVAGAVPVAAAHTEFPYANCAARICASVAVAGLSP